MTQDQITEVTKVYEPTNTTDPTATIIAMSDMMGDVLHACPSQEFTWVGTIELNIECGKCDKIESHINIQPDFAVFFLNFEILCAYITRKCPYFAPKFRTTSLWANYARMPGLK